MDNMRTTTRPNGNAREDQDELRPHYDFDYSTARPNRFAERLSKEAIVVVLDPDVATIFKTSESVNQALRTLLVAVGNLVEPQRSQESAQAAVS